MAGESSSIPLTNGRVVKDADGPASPIRPPRTARKPAPRAFDAPAAAAEGPLAERLRELQAAYGHLGGRELLEALIKEAFPKKIAAVSSFGAESVVLLHLIAQVDPTTPVLFLNTGKLFGETLRYRDRLQDVLGLADVRALHPHADDKVRLDPDGALWSHDPDACCHFRKVLPLERALQGFEAQITGRKRFQTSARKAMDTIEVANGQFKINPLADWDLDRLNAHVAEHKLPVHPLVKDGYLSIGCMPCTDRVKEGGDYRSGRWSGLDKDECGLHTDGGGI